MSVAQARSEAMEALQRDTFNYFVHEANLLNGLIIDKSQPGTPASIAAVGLALSSYPVGVERGFMSRAAAIQRTLATLRFFHDSVQSTDANASGYKGFYYHFLDMASGKRAWKCELSTVDTAFLLAGMLTAAAYFSGDTTDEREIGELADALYRRTDWNWAQDGGLAVTLGWQPESGFLPYRWKGYDEALFLYLLGLGSPTHPLPKDSYAQWTSTYEWREIYGHEFLYSGPLFTHRFLISGSISVASRTTTCAARELTISRTAAAPLSCSSSTPLTIPRDSTDTRPPVGALPRVTVPDRQSARSTAMSANSSTTWRAACRTVRTTEPWLPGQSSLPCPLRPRS